MEVSQTCPRRMSVSPDKRSDFGKLVRGKYAARVAAETNIGLEPEVAEAFPNDSAVNEALRGIGLVA
jgi:hypothetical protein